MSIFREIPPTAGFSIRLKDILSLFSRKNRQGSLEEDFKSYLGAPYAQTTCSGTAAFYFILEALKELSGSKTVVIPAFICPLVPLAIQRAGLKVRVCDINKDNFDFDYEELAQICSQNNAILAIVAVHLAGIPVDLDRIKEIAQRNKIFVIEDCAQSLGAIYKGKKVGASGDFSFFSLCRGKGLTIYEGGVAVTSNKDYAYILDKKIRELAKNDFFSESLKIFELFGYWIFYRPQLFWWVFRLPQLFWNWQGKSERANIEYFTTDFPTHNVSHLRKALGHVLFKRLEEEIEKQRQITGYYLEQLEGIPGIKLIREASGTKANYTYLALIFDTPQKRQRLEEALAGKGLGISRIYLYAITDYDYLRGIVGGRVCLNTRSLSLRHLTLTTSTFLKRKTQDYLISLIKAKSTDNISCNFSKAAVNYYPNKS